jgi:hypothetical protein
MTPSFLTRIFQLLCRHEFSWPHTGAHGSDYQVCLNCGAAYEFDCASMTRTGRLAVLDEKQPTQPRPRISI